DAWARRYDRAFIGVGVVPRAFAHPTHLRLRQLKKQVSPGHSVMSNLDTVIKDLVIANRILAKEDVVDAYGHISVRNPDNPKHFFLSRSVAPDLVERDDIVELGLDGQPVRDEKRALYLERFIHAAIF